ncbi:MAG: hypothetical protein RIR79_2115 [Pseudomonadota bacterium]|jgi:monofunctional biosynthetic peptidoglycan transglycosylase
MRHYLSLAALAFAALQAFFLLRVAVMGYIAPESTSFQRSEMWRISVLNITQNLPFNRQPLLPWKQQWVPYEQIAVSLKQAIILSEDENFTQHNGVEWRAIEKAWNKNERAQQRAEQQNSTKPPKIMGASTITQQLAKNLFLSSERHLWRKGQELMLTLVLEQMLSKRRILEIYLNNVEWGEGIFGAEAAARYYFGKSAAHLNAAEAARLAVMLPGPRAYQKRFHKSPYLATRAASIQNRLGMAHIPMAAP